MVAIPEVREVDGRSARPPAGPGRNLAASPPAVYRHLPLPVRPATGDVSMLHVGQFRSLVVRPVLDHLGMHSLAAELLLVGTALVESRLAYLAQFGGGPALGLFQIEPRTHNDVWRNFLAFRERLAALVEVLAAPWPDRERQLVTNPAYACAIARLVYWRAPDELPGASDIAGMAGYWKRHYNTERGAGREEDFVSMFRQHVVT